MARNILGLLLAPALAVLIPAASYGQGNTLLPSTRMEVNAFPTLAKWVNGSYVTWNDEFHMENEQQGFIERCGASTSVRACWQQIFARYRLEGVTGIRVMFDLNNILDGQGPWEAGLRNFFADMRTAWILNVTPTIGWSASNCPVWGRQYSYQVVANPPPVNNPPLCTNYPSPRPDALQPDRALRRRVCERLHPGRCM